MSDAADIANDVANDTVERALMSRVVYEGESADNCVDCGYQIPSERQLAVKGCQRCTECASLLEC